MAHDKSNIHAEHTASWCVISWVRHWLGGAVIETALAGACAQLAILLVTCDWQSTFLWLHMATQSAGMWCIIAHHASMQVHHVYHMGGSVVQEEMLLSCVALVDGQAGAAA
jgi:hypothetical protein